MRRRAPCRIDEPDRRVASLAGPVVALRLVLPQRHQHHRVQGADETANVELRRFGQAPRFDFKPKEHFDLGEGLGQMDFEAAARMSGARFVVLKKGLARLERAIAQFMLDLHTEQSRENNPNERIEIGGYTEVSPPYLVRDDAMVGTGQLPKFEEDLFEIGARISALNELELVTRNAIDGVNQGNALLDAKVTIQNKFIDAYVNARAQRRWLIPTSEVPLTNLVREQILDDKQLPFRFTAYTPCFQIGRAHV